jgi:glycosyltransferase involved in cell wall biosynthesis
MSFKDLPEFEGYENFNIYRVKCIRLKNSLCTFPEMMTYIFPALILSIKLSIKNKYDINHTHFIFPDGIIAYILKKITGLKYIVTAHGSDVPGYNPDRFKLLHKLFLPFWKTITSNSEKIVLPSHYLRSLAKRINSNLRTSVIPNGIRLNKFSFITKKKEQILIVSRLFERKGVQYILRALSGVKHNYIVNIVGDGPYLTSLKSIACENNLKVNFLGYLDNLSKELRRLYEESEIFIFTSEAENFPIVLLEAMLAGMAIITTNNSGCKEVVGNSAILINSKDPPAIREALIKLINNKRIREKLKYSARKRVEKLFSWRRVARQYLDLYIQNSKKLNTIYRFDTTKSDL